VVFEEGKTPLLFCHWSPQDPQYEIFDSYLSVFYQLDPYYLASVKGVASGTYPLSNIVPDRFYHSEYYRRYFTRVKMHDELGYIISLDEKKTIHLSLGRRTGNRKYKNHARKTLEILEPVLFPLLRQNVTWHLQYDKQPDLPPAQSIVDYLQLLDTEESPLTLREAEVVRLTLQGHSSNSIGHVLEISPWTVKVHRRKVYSKLRVSSQLELFRRFLPLIYS
jgi:DNA-binding CsgD family transcriptional regulator